MKSGAKPTSTRRLITGALTLAAQSYWLYKGFSCFTEIGLASWGKLRADFVALSLSTDVIICEIKSSRADYATDKKWRNYLQHCNSMYFVMMPDTWLKLRDRMEEDGVFEAGVGVLILDPATGYLKCVKHCVRRPISGPAQNLRLQALRKKILLQVTLRFSSFLLTKLLFGFFLLLFIIFYFFDIKS